MSGWRGEHWADPFICDDVDDCQTFLTLKLNDIPATEHRIVPWDLSDAEKSPIGEDVTEKIAASRQDVTGNVTRNVTVTESTQKTTQKTTQKILEAMRDNPEITRMELAALIGITADGVKFAINSLKNAGAIRRVGPDKGGHWEVL